MEREKKGTTVGVRSECCEDRILDEDAFRWVPSETDLLRKQIEHLRKRVDGIANAYEGFKDEFLRFKNKPPALSKPEYDWECDEIPKNATILTCHDFTHEQIEGYITERLEKEEPLWRADGFTGDEARGIISSEIIGSIHAGDWFEAEGT